jgi:AcrR family transcriptional regulator
VAVPRGRRPVGSGTREAIQIAAKRQFAEFGYPRTTMRAIAAEAGVDTRLVTHYFGSKQELFLAVVELPFDPEPTFAMLLGAGRDGLGLRLAGFVVGVLESTAGRQTITGLIRAAASEDAAAAMLRAMLVERLLGPLAHRLGGDHPELRASLLASQIAGVALARHIVGLPELVAARPQVLVAALAPVIEHYLTSPGIGDVNSGTG